MEEEQLKGDAQGKTSALLSCSGSESEGDDVKSQFHCKSDEIMMEENPNPEDLEDEDDSEEDEETDDEDEETDEEDEDVAKGVCDKVSLLEEESSDQGEGDDCPICLNRLKYQDIGTPESCDHSFCLDCIQLWARNVNTCPVDRREFELILARHAGEDEIFKKIPVAEKSFEAKEDTGEAENDLTFCEVCGQSNREDRLLLCDGCDLGFHCECLDPPLDSVPVEEWFCPDCAEANTQRRVINDVEDEAHYFLEESSPSEALPYLRPRRRQIARTRISERVRARIQEYREGLARLVCDDKDSGAFERGSTSTELSRTRSQTRQSEASKKQSTRKSKRLVTGKKKFLSRRKQRRAKTLKKNQILDRLCNTTKSPKSRLAGKLGLTKSRRKSDRTTAEQVAKENLYGIKPLSIMGHKHELDQFDEDDLFGRSSEPQASTSMLSAAASKRSSKYSASALLSRQPVARPLLCKLPDEKANSSLFSCQSSSSGASNSSSSSSAVGGAGLDLLGTIMMEQSILHMKSKDIKINRDGSLTAKKPVPVSVECQSKRSQSHFDYSTSKEDENSKIQVDNDSEKNPESPEEENSTTSVASSHTQNNDGLEKIHNSSSESKEERSPVASGESEAEAKVSEPEEEGEEEEEEEEVGTECSETVDENLVCINEEEAERDEEMDECKGNVSDDTKTTANNNDNDNDNDDDDDDNNESEEEREDSSQDGVLDAASVSNNSDGEDMKSASPDTEVNSQLYKSDDSCAAENNKESTEPEAENTYDPILEEKTISEVDSVGFSPELDLEQQSEAEDMTPVKEGESSCEDVSSVNVDGERHKAECESDGERDKAECESDGERDKAECESDGERDKAECESDGERDKAECESDGERDKAECESDGERNKAECESDGERNKAECESVGDQQEDSDEEDGCPDEVDKSDKEDDTKETGDTSEVEENIKSAEEEDVDEEVPEEECKFDTEDDNAEKESPVDELESVDFDKADKDLGVDEQPSKEMSPSPDNFEKSESAREDDESDENVDSGIPGENLVSDEPIPKKFEIIEEMSDHFDDATSTNMTDLEKVYHESSENYEETNEMVEKEVSGSESDVSSVVEGERRGGGGEKPKIPISELPRIPKRSRRELYKREKSSRSDGPELKSVLGRVGMSDYKMRRGWGKKDRKSRWDPDDWNQSERDLDFISSRDRKSDGNKSYHSDRSESSHESEKYSFEYKESRSRKKRHDISRSHSKSHKESTIDYRDIPHCRYSPEKSKTRKRERSRNHSRSCSRDKLFDYDKSSKRKSRGRSRDKSPGRKSKRHRSYSRSPSRKSHKDRGLSDRRRHRDERKRMEDRVHKRYSDRLEYEEKKNRHHPEDFNEWDDGSCQVIDFPVEQNESSLSKPERSKKSSDRFYKASPNNKVSENFLEKRSSQERSAFKGNKLDDSGHIYNARSTTKKQKFVDRFYKAPHLRDAGTEKFPIHLSEDETEVESTHSKTEPKEVEKSNDEDQVKENEFDGGNSEYDPAFPTESGSPMRQEDPSKVVEKVEEESTPALSESESSSVPCTTTIEETSPTCTQGVVAGDPPFILQENPNVQNLPVQSQNISFPMGLRMIPPNMPQHLMMNPMFLSRPPPFGRLPRMAGPVNRMGWPMNPSGMIQLPPNRFGPAGAMPPGPGLLNGGGFEGLSQEPGQPMSSFKQHPCDPRQLPSQTHSPGQISRTGLPTPPNISHIPPPGPLLTQQHPPPPPPSSQMHMSLPTTSIATTSSQSLSLELDDGQSPASVHLPQHQQQQSLGTIGINKVQPSSEKCLPPNFIVPEMNPLTKLLEARAQLVMLTEDSSKSNEGKQRMKQSSISQNSDIDVFKIPLPPMAPPSLALQLMPPPDALSFSTNTTSTTNNSATTNTFTNSNSSSSNNNNSSSIHGSSSSNTTSNNVKVYKSHQLKLSNSHRSSEAPSAESTEVVDMDVASPLDDDVEIELPASPELDDIDDSKLSSKDSSVIELSVVEDMPASAVELTNLTNKEKHASRLAKGNRKPCQQRTLSPTSTKVSYMGYMKKLQIQERVVDEVKLAIKPFYSGKKIDKNEYKEILRKAVPKICHSKSGNINPAKIKALIEAYVDKLCKTRRCLERRKKSSVKANGERIKKPSR